MAKEDENNLLWLFFEMLKNFFRRQNMTELSFDICYVSRNK